MIIVLESNDKGMSVKDEDGDIEEAIKLIQFAINHYENESKKVMTEFMKEHMKNNTKQDDFEPKNNIEGEWNDTTGQGTD